MWKMTSNPRHSPQTKRNDRNAETQPANHPPSQIWSLPAELAQIVQLQRAVGNQAIVQMLQRSASEEVIQRQGEKRKRDQDDTDDESDGVLNDDSDSAEDSDVGSDDEMEDEVEDEIEDWSDYESDDESEYEPKDKPNNKAKRKPNRKSKRKSNMPHFWSRLVVRSTEDVKLNKHDKNSLNVYKVSISPERRKTAREKEQGDHLIPWSAMLRYWNEQLSNNPLSVVLNKLEKWINSDQAADEAVENNKNLEKNTEKRSHAMHLIKQIRSKTLSPAEMNEKLEQAISLFVEANQASSFAAKGKNSGANAEASAQATLAKLNETISGNKVTGITQNKVKQNALKLLDFYKKMIGFRNQPIIIAIVVYTWYQMLTERYPKLQGVFEKVLLSHEINNKKVEKWREEWEKHEEDWNKKRNNSWWSEQYKKMDVDEDQHTPRETGVLAVVGKQNDQKLLLASEVQIDQVEIPEKLRAKTKYGRKQGSHTLAWTFKRISLIEMFNKKPGNKNKKWTVMEFLLMLAKLIDSDKQSLDSETDYDDLKEQVETLYKKVEDEQSKSHPLHEWILVVNNLFVEYIELNQKLPSTTYGSDSSKSRGEEAANKEFNRTRSAEKISNDDYEKLLELAPKYIDIGFFYNALIIMAPSNFAEPSRKKRKTNSTLESPRQKARDFIEKQYKRHKALLSKVFSDFYFHLQYFHPAFYEIFKTDKKGKQQFVANVFIAPLTRDTVGNKIRDSLGAFINADTLINGLRESIKEESAEWAEELLPTEKRKPKKGRQQVRSHRRKRK